MCFASYVTHCACRVATGAQMGLLGVWGTEDEDEAALCPEAALVGLVVALKVVAAEWRGGALMLPSGGGGYPLGGVGAVQVT